MVEDFSVKKPRFAVSAHRGWIETSRKVGVGKFAGDDCAIMFGFNTVFRAYNTKTDSVLHLASIFNWCSDRAYADSHFPNEIS